MKLFLDLHVIQTVPPSCLNRDDTGSPKTAMYGGARRARVSSQSWKRAIRLYFNEHFNEKEIGYRTLRIFNLVADEIKKLSPDRTDEDAMALATSVFGKVSVKQKKDSSKSEALFFISTQQAKNLAALALGDIEGKEAEKAIAAALTSGNSVDLALFGRMVASNPELNCDASAQVAHAISTHRVENEYDYFTAVDDMSKEEHAGAGMIGTVEYNSATLYRFATVACHELYKNLSKDADVLEKAIGEFTKAFIMSIPTGKQNTFAAHTLPYAVMAAFRPCRPLNLADAFEKPITPKLGEGFTERSAIALVDHANKSYKDFCAEPESCYVIGDALAGLKKAEILNLEDLVAKVGKEAAEKVAK